MTTKVPREVIGRVGDEKIERAIRQMMDHGMRSREAAEWVRDWIMHQAQQMRPGTTIELWRDISDLTYAVTATQPSIAEVLRNPPPQADQ